MGKWRAIIPITFALVVSLIASFLIYQWLQTQTVTEVSGNGHMTSESNIVAVAVAAGPGRAVWGPALRASVPGGTRYR